METIDTRLNDDLLPPKRSTFLTVLCVLTFLGSVYGIFTAITAYRAAPQLVEKSSHNMDSVKTKARRDDLEGKHDAGSKFALKMMDSVKVMMDEKKIKISAIISLFANLVTLGGALLMWRLNPIGFYVYIVGTLILVLHPLFIYGTGSFIPILSAIFYGFFGLVFIVMYAFNLKDMRPTKIIT